MRFVRTLSLLSIGQIAHRLRLRLRRAARRALSGAALRAARLRAGDTPSIGRAVPAPDALLRPCPIELIARAADDAARGAFRFLSVGRVLGPRPFPPPRDASLLWAFEHEYLEGALDLAMTGRGEDAVRLVSARVATERRPGPAGLSPYTEARRAQTLVRVLTRTPEAHHDILAAAAWSAACRVAANLERDVGGNHLLENGLALVLAGAAFRGPRARRLLAVGERILAEGLREQVLPDGAHYELSAMYHARVLAVFAEGALALHGAGRPPPVRVFETLASMCSWLEGVLGPRGELPLLGDSVRDDRLSPRSLLAAVEEAIPFRPPPVPSGDRFYRDSGVLVLDDARDGHRLVLDAGPVCPEHLPAHGQADTFTFELWIGGEPMIVDPGVAEYEAGARREYSRSTRAHSTVEVNGEDSSEVWSSFRVGRRARVFGKSFRREGNLGTFCGEHDGYRHRGATHRRLVSHLAPGLWLVVDAVEARRPLTCRSRLHLAPGSEVTPGSAGAFDVRRGGAFLRIAPFPGGGLSFEDGWHSPAFGARQPSRLAVLTGSGRRVISGYALAAGPGEPLEVRLDGAILRVRAGARWFERGLP